jgi:hypothetical protein
LKNLFIIALVPLVLAGCDRHKNKNPITNAKEAAKDTSLQGKVFESDCSTTPLSAAFSGLMTKGETALQGARTQIKAEGANLTRRTLYFTKTDCSGPVAFTFEELGEMDIDKNQTTNDGGRFVDIMFKAVKVKIDSREGATIANALKMCRKEDWAVGQEQDVTAVAKDAACYNAQVPRMDANIYRVEGDKLYLGSLTKSQRETAARPTSLDSKSVLHTR